MRTRKVKGTSISNLFRRIKNIMGEDIKESYQVTPYGYDSNPVDNATSVESGTNKYAVTTGYIQKAIEDLEKGEVCVFSKNSKGELQSTIKLRDDSTIEFLGDEDNLVRFSDLKSEFNELKGRFNTLVTNYNALVSAFNTHTHTYTPGDKSPIPSNIPSAQGLPSLPSIANIDKAKHEALKTDKGGLL